eukprot:TRINITY_DN40803_c0_g2_i1.p1 TRINITY_DN40803_c0_g2~~TRINITY_DN40803_c0_g2_i1.p1  ORF type:complete len:434 (-),score=101.90 TRINITY_DN40803_c0_g2_i1:127-1428(-)
MSALCLVWDRDGDVKVRREAAAFVRDYPSGFERDLRLRAPKRGEGAAGQPVPFFVCRHVATCEESDNPPLRRLASNLSGAPPHPVPLVKSCLQKAVRRGLARAAVAAAVYLLAWEPKELLRRLPVVLVEDVGVFEDVPRLTWLSVAVQSGYELSTSDLRFLLELVAAAAQHPVQTAIPSIREESATAVMARLLKTGEDSVPYKELNGRAEQIALCTAVRACYGGMPGDIEMLLAFASNPSAWVEMLVPSAAPRAAYKVAPEALADEWLAELQQPGAGRCRWGQALAVNEQVEEAVDFHCSDIVPRLLRSLSAAAGASVPPLPRASLPPEAELKEAMWTHRSSLNFRQRLPEASAGKAPLPSWWNQQLEAELRRLSQAIWSERPRPPPQASTATGQPGLEAGGGASKKRKVAAASGRQLTLFRFAGPAAGGAGA